eukprot:10607970-Alexandrium_andersonii.AAC.1
MKSATREILTCAAATRPWTLRSGRTTSHSGDPAAGGRVAPPVRPGDPEARQRMQAALPWSQDGA